MIKPADISIHKKYRFLLGLSEDDFRDKVIRPLFLRLGFTGGKEYCGINEEGKDCIFVDVDKLMNKTIYAVQTKRGDLKKTREANQNVVVAATQIKTALESKIVLLSTKQKVLPDYVILCASGEINKTAQEFICESVQEPRIKFYDRDELIHLIDQHYSELWLGIDAEKMPYLRKLKQYLSQFDENSAVSDLISSDSKLTVVTNERYVPLKISFTREVTRKYKGQFFRGPKIEEIPAEALLKIARNRFLILGEAGAGKSTILKRLAYILCEQLIEEGKNIILPVLLRTIDIVDSDQKLLDLCLESMQKISSSDKACFSAEDLQQGNLVVLIDALDEEEDSNKIKLLLKKIEEFIESYPSCKIIVTSRDYAYIRNLEELSKYEEYRILNFNLNQARQIVEKLIKGRSLPKEFLQGVLRRLQDVHGLDLNPLLVTVFVATSEYSRKDIPANITELFKKFTEMMLGRWDSTKGLSQQYQSQVKDFLLQKLAFAMHEKKIVSIKEEDCIKIFTQELEKRGKKETDIKQLIHESLYRSGLFRCIEGKVEFRHLLLQEFFAGRGIHSPEIIRSLIKDPWWKRALVFYFGENPGDNTALEKAIENIPLLTPLEQFQTAITVGLSLQACYLMEIAKKLPLFQWVLGTLSIVEPDSLTDNVSVKQKFPLMLFIHYYLFGRDSVASEILKDNSSGIIDNLIKDSKVAEEKIKFWVIVGLIESGDLQDAESYLKAFRPKDKRLFLALHLGCFLIEHLKIFSKAEQRIASRICGNFANEIKDLRKQILDEFSTELLEVRKDNIAAIEHKS